MSLLDVMCVLFRAHISGGAGVACGCVAADRPRGTRAARQVLPAVSGGCLLLPPSRDRPRDQASTCSPPFIFFFFRKLILDVQIGLAGVVLQLKALGVRELSEFEFLERPSVAALKRAVELLLRLGALSPRGDLTPLGKDMVPARSLFVCVESARRSSALQYPA